MNFNYRSYFTLLFTISFLVIFLKFIVFDLIWTSSTTFTSFSYIQSYINKVGVALLFSFPVLLLPKRLVYFVTQLVLDIFLICNLMYFRTYYTVIPLDSYLLLGNLSGFTASVYDSFSWADLCFPLSTLTGWCIYIYRRDKRENISRKKQWTAYWLTLSVTSLVIISIYAMYGGILSQNERLQSANYNMVRTPLFTVFGSLYCDYLLEEAELTPHIQQDIQNWFANQLTDSNPVDVKEKKSCIVILAESFESWVLENEVEGKEITPYLNNLLKEKNTIYAPHVLTQVKGGRSIDAQLLLYTGLLPIENGAYSIKFPQTYFPTLIKAFKEKYSDGKAYIMTVDKDITWNQNIVARNFGFDSLIWKKNFIMDERIGFEERKNLGDYSFLSQCVEKISSEELWPSDTPVFMQCVTYSGHTPFRLQDKYKHISFSEDILQPMNDYITMANYTDRAIGHFVQKIRADRKFDDTMIIITGDHEGLASDRKWLSESPCGEGTVSPERYVPFIVLNAPYGMRYEEVLGQVDLYPTMLDLLGLDQYEWRGLGYSLLDTTNYEFAVSPQMDIVGDTTGVGSFALTHAMKAWNISDYLIRFNLLEEQDYSTYRQAKLQQKQ